MATNRKTGTHKISRGEDGETFVSEPVYAERGYVFSDVPERKPPPTNNRESAFTPEQRVDEMYGPFRKFITIRKD
jgi:hypothetical protein